MSDVAEMTALVAVVLLAMAVIVVLGELLVPGTWACFPGYCS